MVALFAGLAMVASVITATQLASNALESREDGLGAGECLADPPQQEADPATENQAADLAEEAAGAGEAPAETNASEDLVAHEEDGHVHYRRPGWGEAPPESPPPGDDPPATPDPGESPPPADCDEEGDGGAGGEDPGEGEGPGDGDGGDPGDGGGGPPGDGEGGAGTVPPGGADGANNGLEILGRDCTVSDLPLHDGFQSAEARCVNTQAGEVSAAENNPTVLITEFPDWVEVNEPFTITVSTRNLVRDRFLGAGAGGFLLESSYLTEEGIQRGHFHTGCLNLVDGNVAPQASTTLEPQFFAAVEDGGGGAGADFVTIEIPGLPTPGMYRCQVWAGDPSHRLPMMSFARQQVPADAVRITVTEPGEQ
jgi:hypothetical protein